MAILKKENLQLLKNYFKKYGLGANNQWVVKYSHFLGVRFLLPPQDNNPYMFSEGTEDDESILGMWGFSDYSVRIAFFSSDDVQKTPAIFMASGNTAYKNNEELFKGMKTLIKSGDEYKVDKIKDLEWKGRDIMQINIQGPAYKGDFKFYILTTPSKSFIVVKKYGEADEKVRSIIDTIFENIEFPPHQ